MSITMAVRASPGASDSLATTFWEERWILLNGVHHAAFNGCSPALFECETKEHSWFHLTAISRLDAHPSKFGLCEAILAESMTERMIIYKTQGGVNPRSLTAFNEIGVFELGDRRWSNLDCRKIENDRTAVKEHTAVKNHTAVQEHTAVKNHTAVK